MPAINLETGYFKSAKEKIEVGAQNINLNDAGAFTGETSASMVSSIGIKNVLVGHSERRESFGETDGEVNKKIKIALKNGLNPTLCVGELLEEKKANLTNKVIKKQITIALEDISAAELSNIIIAYEPV